VSIKRQVEVGSDESRMVIDNVTDTAYNLAVQVIGNAFIARRSMVDCKGGEFIDLVLSDASTALGRLGATLENREAADHLLVVTAIIESLRHTDHAAPRDGAVSAA
jgi:hypothetical protein